MSTDPKSTSAGDAVIAEITSSCLLTRTRRLSRLVTNTYDQALRPFGVNAPQFSLLVLIAKFGPASRAEIGRVNYQDRSTLTRNLALLQAEGWVEELKTDAGRSRPIAISSKGSQLLASAAPAWRQAQAEVRNLIGDDAASNILRVVDGIPLDRLQD
jgi:DNA-binding MarR family transcriptional regulator